MTVSPSIPAPIETRRGRLFGGALLVAAAVAGLTWGLLSLTVDTGSTSTRATSPSLVQQAQDYGRGLTEIGKLGTASCRPSDSSLRQRDRDALARPAGRGLWRARSGASTRSG